MPNVSQENQYSFARGYSGSYEQVQGKVDAIIESTKMTASKKLKKLESMLEYHSNAAYDNSQDSVEYINQAIIEINFG